MQLRGNEDSKMTVDDFRQSLTVSEPPAGLTSAALIGLWRDVRGDWMRAHESAQPDEGVEGSWVHAYLRRKEGDQGQRRRLAQPGKPVCREPLVAEWLGIVKKLLEYNPYEDDLSYDAQSTENENPQIACDYADDDILRACSPKTWNMGHPTCLVQFAERALARVAERL